MFWFASDQRRVECKLQVVRKWSSFSSLSSFFLAICLILRSYSEWHSLKRNHFQYGVDPENIFCECHSLQNRSRYRLIPNLENCVYTISDLCFQDWPTICFRYETSGSISVLFKIDLSLIVLWFRSPHNTKLRIYNINHKINNCVSYDFLNFK